MNQNMPARKAFWHAVATVFTGAVLASGLLLLVVRIDVRNWPILAAIIFVPALLIVPFLRQRYLDGPPPPLAPQKHLREAIWCACIAIGYLALCWGKWIHVRSLWSLCYVALFLLLSLNHLRQAYKKKGNLSPTQ
jgi:hypothetical protein